MDGVTTRAGRAQSVEAGAGPRFRRGQRFAGRYELVELLGAGGFGCVWRARDLQLDRDVALKLFHAADDCDGTASSRCRELACLARLHHDGVVHLLDQSCDAEVPFLVLEFVPGRPLDQVVAALARLAGRPDRDALAAAIGTAPVAGHPLEFDRDWFRTAARIVAMLLRAVGSVHEAGVVHRDLKPANVMLRPDGHPVVLDFGLGAVVDDAAGPCSGRLRGTIAYLAPEQLQQLCIGRDVRTDVYQCGLLLYELLTFHRAFEGVARDRLPEFVRAGRIEPPDRLCADVPPQLAAVCMRSLARQPERRYATAAAFRFELERWLHDRSPKASLGGVAHQLWRRGCAIVGRQAARLAMAAGRSIGAGLGLLVALWCGTGA